MSPSASARSRQVQTASDGRAPLWDARPSSREAGAHAHTVDTPAGRSAIHVVDDADGKYLRTAPDGIAENNLDALPDC